MGLFSNKKVVAAASSASFLGQCDVLAPALVTPLRAILWALALTFLPHVLRVPLVLRLKGRYNNMMPRSHQVSDKDVKQNPGLVKAIQVRPFIHPPTHPPMHSCIHAFIH